MANSTQKSSSKRRFLTDAELKAMAVGGTATESLPGRGSGSIYFECRASGVVEGYYRRRDGGKAQKIKLGPYRATHRSAGLTLAEFRTKAQELARIAAEHGDPKEWLAEQEVVAEVQRLQRLQGIAEAQRLAEIEAARGTLRDLIGDYVESRRSVVGANQLAEFERHLRKDLSAPRNCWR